MSTTSTARIPDIGLQQLVFQLTLPDSLVADKAEKRTQLLTEIEKNEMAPFYESVCELLKWPVDTALLQKLKDANQKKLNELDERQKIAESNEGESEIRDIMEERANYYAKIGDKTAALEAFRQTVEKTVGQGGKIDLVFSQIRIGLFFDDKELVQRNIEKSNSLVEQGGDWDRRNRLKVYEGVFAMSRRDFRTAAMKLLDSVATFTSTELLSFSQFVFYVVAVALLALDRLELKKQVVHSPEILTVIDDHPHLRDLLNAFYKCNYRLFMQSLVHVTEAFRRDRFLAPHADHYCREMRIKAYTQFLDSYKSVTLASMARAFGVSVGMLDDELSRFVAAHRLTCKIDLVSGVVETTRVDTRNSQYYELVQLGDALMHRMQKLSRVINA